MTRPRIRRSTPSARRPRRGILLADVMTATAIVAVLAASLFVLLSRASQVSRKMTGARAATRAAESMLADLQSARPPLSTPGQEVTVQPEPGGAAVGGYAWVRVTATVAGQSADVVGLVPDGPVRQARDGPGVHRAQAANPTARSGPSSTGPATRGGAMTRHGPGLDLNTAAGRSVGDRQGYLLVEMMLLLALFSVFALVGFRLFVTSLNCSIDAQRRTETAGLFDQAMDQLRDDVWRARSIQADGRSTTLLLSDGRKIIWRIDPATPADPTPSAVDTASNTISLSRNALPDDPSTSTRWTGLPPGIEFTAAGPTLRVRTPSASAGADDTDWITMTSQLQLAGSVP